jgi:hypothetical protein
MGGERAGAGLALFFAAMMAAAPGFAQWKGWDYDYDREVKPWQELRLQLPAYPKSADLIEFDAGAATPHRYFIDEKSVSVGEDGVVRYTLMIKAAGGATNVSFEGMRCETRERKTYALGHADGTWHRARHPAWRRIENREVDRYYNALYGEVFCRGKSPVDTPKEAIQALKYGPARYRG